MRRRALLSVSDKTGIVNLARGLVEQGFELLSTGGTARELLDHSIAVTLISDFTESPEILGGRVKTLHPKIFGGILYDRDQAEHRRDAVTQKIEDIDVVVVNLYPFQSTVVREGVTDAEAIEQIDIGGPSLLRAAAKNHKHVLPLGDPALYEEFLSELRGAGISQEFRRKAARQTFEMTSRYDAAIAGFLAGSAADGSTLELNLVKAQALRYGENPHQSASLYLESGRKLDLEQLHGKELSYNNLLDLDAAWQLATAFADPACVVVKHTNPAGAASSSTLADAIGSALACDPASAFGGIIGVNRELDLAAAKTIGTLFLEVIVAPGFSSDALKMLRDRKNLRLIKAGNLGSDFEIRSAVGGYLIQTRDRVSESEWKVVTRRQPKGEEMSGLRFAWTVAAHVKSNAIVVARGNQLVGVGAGQMSRVDSAKIAIMKSLLPTTGTVAASDAFFPFRDGLDILADAGIKAVVQPGGSVRDQEVISAADERGLSMVFTGERHFRH